MRHLSVCLCNTHHHKHPSLERNWMLGTWGSFESNSLWMNSTNSLRLSHTVATFRLGIAIGVCVGRRVSLLMTEGFNLSSATSSVFKGDLKGVRRPSHCYPELGGLLQHICITKGDHLRNPAFHKGNLFLGVVSGSRRSFWNSVQHYIQRKKWRSQKDPTAIV